MHNSRQPTRSIWSQIQYGTAMKTNLVGSSVSQKSNVGGKISMRRLVIRIDDLGITQTTVPVIKSYFSPAVIR